MEILLIGLGRMGLRHLRGLSALRGTIRAVDPRPAAADDATRVAAEERLAAKLCIYKSLEAALDGGARPSAAILTATAGGRAEQFDAITRAGVRHALLEKPLAQSRAAVRRIAALAQERSIHARCNLYRRSLSAYHTWRGGDGPLTISISGGAFGLGCNGIHWIDFALHLTGAETGRLLWGEVDATPIASGRGAEFRDFGGRGVFALGARGDRLLLACDAASSAPAVCILTRGHRQWIIDQEPNEITTHERSADSALPNYRYGAQYRFERRHGLEQVDFAALTRAWLRSVCDEGPCPQPLLSAALTAHELLFDLLETSGMTEFPIT